MSTELAENESMLKEKAVASLGQDSLLMPAWIKAALAANDRLKLYLTPPVSR